jgi:hypothetical protein
VCGGGRAAPGAGCGGQRLLCKVDRLDSALLQVGGPWNSGLWGNRGMGPAWLLAGVVVVGVGPRESVNLYFEFNSHAKILKFSGWQAATGQKIKILELAWASGQGVSLAFNCVSLN